MQLLLQVLNTEPKTDGKASEIAIDVATQTGEEIPFADILAAAHTAAKGATADIVLPEPGRKVPETRHALLGDTLVSQGEGDLPGDPLVATPAPLLKGPLPDAKPDIPTGRGH